MPSTEVKLANIIGMSDCPVPTKFYASQICILDVYRLSSFPNTNLLYNIFN